MHHSDYIVFTVTTSVTVQYRLQRYSNLRLKIEILLTIENIPSISTGAKSASFALHLLINGKKLNNLYSFH